MNDENVETPLEQAQEPITEQAQEPITDYNEEEDSEENSELLKQYFSKMHENINPIFKKQQDIAQNLNKVRIESYNKYNKQFKDDAEKYVKSIGTKVINDTNPELGDIIEEATLIDKQLKPNRIKMLDDSKKYVLKIIDDIKNKSNNRGSNKIIETIEKDLKRLGYINPETLDALDSNDKYTKEKLEELKAYAFPFSLESPDDFKYVDKDKLDDYLTTKINAAEKVHNRLKAYRTDLQQQLESYKDNSFLTSKQVAIDRFDEFYKDAEPTLEAYKELISKYSEYLTPNVITELENNVKQIKDYINDARLKGVDAGKLKEHIRLVNKVRKNVRDNYQDILNKLNAYSNSVSAEDAIISEIKSLASYEQYSMLPPAIFEKLPDEIKNKVIRLMELKAKLQKQQGKTKNISQKYKINSSNHPVSSDKSYAKILNPMLTKGYSIFNKVAQHNVYNSSFA